MCRSIRDFPTESNPSPACEDRVLRVILFCHSASEKSPSRPAPLESLQLGGRLLSRSTAVPHAAQGSCTRCQSRPLCGVGGRSTPCSASLVVADLTVPGIRFVCRPEVLAFEGTEAVEDTADYPVSDIVTEMPSNARPLRVTSIASVHRGACNEPRSARCQTAPCKTYAAPV